MRMSSLAIGLMLVACVSCGHGRLRNSFADVASRATLIEIKHTADRDYPGGVSIARFHLRYDPHVFSALASARPAGRPTGALTGVKLVLCENTRTYDIYDYEPTTGSIHVGEEWLQVPEDLRQRFKKIITDARNANLPHRRVLR